MNKLPVRAGVGLVVLNTPLPQVSNRFKSLFPQILSYVDNLLYVHILPEATLMSQKSRDDGVDCSENKIVANWTKVATNIYSHGSSKPNLDLRLLLTGVKNPLISSISQLKTNHRIEVVLFDPNIESKWVQEYKKGCLGEMLGTSINEPKHITLDLPVETENIGASSSPKTKSTDKVYNNVVLGGTFDRIHAGHKILLTSSLLRCKNEITIGITDGEDMMRKKVLPELMLSCEQRIHEVKEFIKDVDSSLQQYKVVPITDPFGPSIVDSNLQLIIGSQETEKGCKKVNQVRKEKELSLLDVHVIDLVDDDIADKSSPENEGKVSSSSQRMRLLGNELNKPLKKWDKENSPYLIGLTGGSCGGKTNIAKYLETLGAGVINCDLLGHEAYHPGTLGFTKVVDAFGEEMIGSDGLIDRRKLGAKVFGIENEKNKQKLESIVWPEIWKIVEKQIAFMWKEQGKHVVIIDAAVLLQAGWKEQVNQVWVSIVDPETAVKRIMERDQKSEVEAQKRLSSQFSNQKYVNDANVVFCSKWEVSYTRKQVDKAWMYLNENYIKK